MRTHLGLTASICFAFLSEGDVEPASGVWGLRPLCRQPFLVFCISSCHKNQPTPDAIAFPRKTSLYDNLFTSPTMVSPLTDRLLSGYSSSGTSSATSGRLSGEAKLAATANDSSGYSADQEQSAQAAAPPFYIDLLSRHGKRHATDDLHDGAPDEKRKRVENEMETNYLAHSARHEIARGGLRCPKINLKKPRLASAGIDFSHVSLIHSKDFFMTPRKPDTSKSPWNVTMSMSPDLCIDALQSIVKSCYSHYQGVSNVPAEPVARTESKTSETEGDASDVASTTSSVTEDGVEEVAAPKSTISMGQALSISKQPRYVCFYRFECSFFSNSIFVIMFLTSFDLFLTE